MLIMINHMSQNMSFTQFVYILFSIYNFLCVRLIIVYFESTETWKINFSLFCQKKGHFLILCKKKMFWLLTFLIVTLIKLFLKLKITLIFSVNQGMCMLFYSVAISKEYNTINTVSYFCVITCSKHVQLQYLITFSSSNIRKC